MARQESSREDLLREATALVERIEVAPRDASAHIVAGFRRDGSLSIFFGEDLVYHFNAAGELRRAFTEGMLLKAERGHLVGLRRVRTQREVQLIRHDMTGAEEKAFLARMADTLRKLAAMLDASAFDVVGQEPPESEVLGRLRARLLAHNQCTIAARPNA
jgi:hypothetical protein